MGGACDAEDFADVGFLQVHAKPATNTNAKHRLLPDDITKVWTELKGPVGAEKVKAAIAEATDSEAVKELTKRLADLQERFPDADEIKENSEGVCELLAEMEK